MKKPTLNQQIIQICNANKFEINFAFYDTYRSGNRRVKFQPKLYWDPKSLPSITDTKWQKPIMKQLSKLKMPESYKFSFEQIHAYPSAVYWALILRMPPHRDHMQETFE